MPRHITVQTDYGHILHSENSKIITFAGQILDIPKIELVLGKPLISSNEIIKQMKWTAMDDGYYTVDDENYLFHQFSENGEILTSVSKYGKHHWRLYCPGFTMGTGHHFLSFFDLENRELQTPFKGLYTFNNILFERTNFLYSYSFDTVSAFYYNLTSAQFLKQDFELLKLIFACHVCNMPNTDILSASNGVFLLTLEGDSLKLIKIHDERLPFRPDSCFVDGSDYLFIGCTSVYGLIKGKFVYGIGGESIHSFIASQEGKMLCRTMDGSLYQFSMQNVTHPSFRISNKARLVGRRDNALVAIKSPFSILFMDLWTKNGASYLFNDNNVFLEMKLRENGLQSPVLAGLDNIQIPKHWENYPIPTTTMDKLNDLTSERAYYIDSNSLCITGTNIEPQEVYDAETDIYEVSVVRDVLWLLLSSGIQRLIMEDGDELKLKKEGFFPCSADALYCNPFNSDIICLVQYSEYMENEVVNVLVFKDGELELIEWSLCYYDGIHFINESMWCLNNRQLYHLDIENSEVTKLVDGINRRDTNLFVMERNTVIEIDLQITEYILSYIKSVFDPETMSFAVSEHEIDLYEYLKNAKCGFFLGKQ
ncbi:hypothetical protein PCE1_004147 [Barthelona sp. PCE]